MDNPTSTFIFHRPEFIFRNPETSIITFESPESKIYFSREGNLLTSLDKSPFGSFLLTNNVTKNDLISLVEKFQRWAKENNVTMLMIRSFPEIYQHQFSTLIHESLTECGFHIKYEDVTQVISVTTEGSMNLNAHKKRRLRQAKASEFSFREIPLHYLEESYALIVESRQNKNYPVTMKLSDLEAMYRLFPSDYLLFGVFDKNKMIATAVCIKVNHEILYCFYIGDDLAYRSHSPVTLLIGGVFDYCQANHFRLLDLGTSTDKGVLNKGLYDFKKTFGSFDSRKLTFLKQL